MSSTISSVTESASQELESHDAPKWLVVLAKAGYGARGLVYVVIGSLAITKALGMGGETTDSKEAVSKMMEAPGGVFLLGFVALGLVGYSVWRFIQSILDADGHGTDAKGLAVRTGLFISGVTHLTLAYFAAQLALQNSSSSGGGGKEGAVAKILQYPGGQWIVGAIGLCVIGAGVAHAVKAYKEKYRKRFDADPQTMRLVNPVCKFGLTARGVAFGIIGGLLIYSAVTQNPDNAGGLAEVLDEISQQAFGTTLLLIMAAGLLCFGLYSIFESAYRRISGPS